MDFLIFVSLFSPNFDHQIFELKNIFPNGLLYLEAQPKNPLVSNYELCWSLGTHRKMDPITYEKSNQLLTIPPIPYTP